MMSKNKKKTQKTLTTPQQLQTAAVTSTGRIIADHPSNRITPSKLKSIFEDAERGDITAQHELFCDIEERDSNIAANIQTRKRAILTLDWRIVAPRNATAQEEQYQQEIDEFFYQFVNLEDLLIDLMDSVGHGFAALEILWQQYHGKWIPKQFIPRPQSWFRLDDQDNLLLKSRDNPMGEALLPFGWVIHQHKSRSTQLARVGLYRTLAWLYMFKHYSVHDFAEFLELYGMPIRIGKFGAGATAEEKRTLLRALAEIGHNAAGIMPETMKVELHNVANSAGQNNPFLQMVDWCEKSIARLILGQTLTSGADGKSSTNALGNVHNEVRRDLLVSDAKQLAQTLTKQIILPYLQINLNANIDPTRIPYFEFDTKEREDLNQYAEALPKLVEIGVKIPERFVREKLGIPEASDDEEILQFNALTPEPTALSQSHCTCCQPKGVALSHEEVSTQQAILDEEQNKAFADIDFNRQLDPMVKQAVALLQSCDDYEQAAEALARLYPDLEDGQHQRYLTQGLFVAELLGVSDV